MGIVHKITFGWKVMKTYSNWGMTFLEDFKLLKKKKVVYRLRNGMKFYGRPYTHDFGIINDVMVKRSYHKYLPHLKKGGLVIDIGGQIGVFSVLAARMSKQVQVLSFEPFNDNYTYLCENIALNRLEKQISPIKLGVGRKKETRTLYINRKRSGNHTMYEDMYLSKLKNTPYEKVKIDIISLDQVFKKYKIKQCDLLKLDCEGAEYEIILNASNATLKKIKTICMEYHPNGNVKEIADFLLKKGFMVSYGKSGSRLLYARLE